MMFITLRMTYYDGIAQGYDELHGQEQVEKLELLSAQIRVGKTLLDVGCGSGISTGWWGVCATGIDPSEGLLKLARRKYPHCTFIQGVAERLPFADRSFDTVISVTAVQNFDDIFLGVREILRVARQQAIITHLKVSGCGSQVQKALEGYQCTCFVCGREQVYCVDVSLG